MSVVPCSSLTFFFFYEKCFLDFRPLIAYTFLFHHSISGSFLFLRGERSFFFFFIIQFRGHLFFYLWNYHVHQWNLRIHNSLILILLTYSFYFVFFSPSNIICFTFRFTIFSSWQRAYVAITRVEICLNFTMVLFMLVIQKCCRKRSKAWLSVQMHDRAQ